MLSNELKMSYLKINRLVDSSQSIQDTFLTFFKGDCPKQTKSLAEDTKTPRKLQRSKSGDKIKIFEDYDDNNIQSPVQYQSHHRSDDPEFHFQSEAKLDIVPAFAKCLLADVDCEPRNKNPKRFEKDSGELTASRPSVHELQKSSKPITSFSMYKNNAVKNKSNVSNYKPHYKGKNLINFFQNLKICSLW